jgi:hypothetical protein
MDHEVAVATRDVTVACGVVHRGRVAGQRWRWTATVGGEPRIVFSTTYRMADDLDPDWGIERDKYAVTFEGDPALRCGLEARGTFTGREYEEGEEGAIGRTWAAMNSVNTIPAVCDAAPGIRSHLDLPLVIPTGLVAGG